MRLRVILLLLIAVGVGLGTVQLTRQWLENERARFERAAPEAAPTPAPASQFVLVAAADLPPGHFIIQDDLRWQAWPDDTLAENYIVRRGGSGGGEPNGQLVGAVVRNSVSGGQPVTENMVVRPGERGFLAAVLTPGMRAISVPVNDTTSVAGFVFPGDRVDLLLTHTVRIAGNRDSGDDPAFRATETILTDVRVLAIDQRLTDPADGPRIPHTATIEVDPREAEMVQVMMQMGALSLSLRSLSPAGAGPAGEEADKPRPQPPSSDPVRSLLTFVQQQLPEGTLLTAPDRTFTLDTEVSLLRGLMAALDAMPREETAAPPEVDTPPSVVVVRGNATAPSS